MKTLLVNISPKSTTDQSKGHWHWAHSAFIAEAETFFDQVINLSASITENPLGRGLLSGLYDEGMVPISTISKDARAIRNLLKEYENHSIVFHIYEGSIDSLILIGMLISELENSTGIVNLHWADFLYGSAQSRIFIETLKRYQVAYSRRIQIAAESERLAALLRQKGVLNVVEYPVFSVHSKSNSRDKKFDVLVTADDIPELNYFVQSSMKFHEVTGHFLKVAISLGRHLYPWPFGPELITYLENANFKVFTGGLSWGEYSELLSSSKAQILLYSSPFYAWGSSGRLLDGLQCQTKSIVPSNTALSDYVETKEVGWVFDIRDANALTSLLVMLSKLEDKDVICSQQSIQVSDCINWVRVITTSKLQLNSVHKVKLTLALGYLISYQRYMGIKSRLRSKASLKTNAKLITHQESLRLSNLQQMVNTLDEIKNLI